MSIEYMVKGALRLALPNPHHGVIGRDLLARILRQAGITREEWEAQDEPRAAGMSAHYSTARKEGVSA